jgi:hypothetical protein
MNLNQYSGKGERYNIYRNIKLDLLGIAKERTTSVKYIISSTTQVKKSLKEELKG